MTSTQRTLPLSKLNLNTNNPRFDPVKSQEEALKKFLESNSDDLYNLARDIKERGLNPSEFPIVYLDNDGNLIVKDGNRRITAIFAITNPKKIPTTNQAYKRRFELLRNDVDLPKIKRIPCVVFDDEDDADYWVNLKHTGKNNGVGTAPWTALMQERFKAQRFKPSIQLQAFTFVEENASAELLSKLDSEFPITTLQRMISSPEFRDAIGFELVDGDLKYNIEKSEAIRNLSKIVEDLATKEIKVDDVKRPEQIMSYVNGLRKNGLVTTDRKMEQSVLVTTKQELTPQNNVNKNNIKKLKPVKVKRRRRLIPEDWSITIDQPRINNIYQELKVMDIDRFPNAGSVLFRVFIELSLNHYITENAVKNINVDSELINKIKRVQDYMIEKGIVQKEELQGLMLLCNQGNDQPIPMTKEFNGYVHNPHFNPLPDLLKGTWDNISKFIEKIWE